MRSSVIHHQLRDQETQEAESPPRCLFAPHTGELTMPLRLFYPLCK